MNREKYKNRYRIDSIRLKNFDYGSNGSYFITICTRNMINYFGEIYDGEVYYNKLGRFAMKCWGKIEQIHPYAIADELIIMPNHLHGIITISKSVQTPYMASKSESEPTQARGISPVTKNYEYKNSFGPQSQNLASIVRGFKSAVTIYAKKNKIFFKWQPNYHDRVIRNEKEFRRIQQYIISNPLRWEEKKHRHLNSK